MTRTQSQYQQKTPCLQVQTLFTTHFNDFWTISFSFFSMLLKLHLLQGATLYHLSRTLFVIYTDVSLYIYCITIVSNVYMFLYIFPFSDVLMLYPSSRPSSCIVFFFIFTFVIILIKFQKNDPWKTWV